MPGPENDAKTDGHSLARASNQSSELDGDVSATELAGILTDPGRTMAVRFRHGDIDMAKGGGVLENVPADTDIGRVRDACLARGWKLVITEQRDWQVYARIVHSSVTDEQLETIKDCNMFKRLEDGPTSCNFMDMPNFEPRSFGVARVSICDGPHFKTLEDIEEYLQLQFENGFRGIVLIQGHFPLEGGGASCPFVEAVKVTDAGLEIVRNDALLRKELPGYQSDESGLLNASIGNRSGARQILQS